MHKSKIKELLPKQKPNNEQNAGGLLSAKVLPNPMLAVLFFSVGKAYADGVIQTVYFKPKKTFEQIKDNILHCFKLGAYKVELYKDARYSDGLTIRKEDFSNSEIIEGFIKTDTKNKIEAIEKRKLNILSNIEFNKKSLLKLEKEISKLQSALN